MGKRTYSIDAPDQQRLKIARVEIEAVLKKYDLAGVVVLHTPGMSEFFYDITPSYSCVRFDPWHGETSQLLRVKSKASDYAGDTAAQVHDQAATANMGACLADGLYHAAKMFIEIRNVLDESLRAEHTEGSFTPDPNESKRQ